MSNWFEHNPTKSVISYTLVIIAATWAVSTFVIEDNRLNLAQAQLEAQKALTEQYKSKSELLQRDIDAIRSENSEYRSWLGKIDNAIPVIIPTITELKQKISELEAAAAIIKSVSPVDVQPDRDVTVRVGTAYIDAETGLIFTVISTNPNRTAKISIKLPESDAPMEDEISPGKQWRFKFNGEEFLITAVTISFLGDFVDLRINLAK